MIPTKAIRAFFGRLFLAAAIFWTAAYTIGERRPFLSTRKASLLWGEGRLRERTGEIPRALQNTRRLLLSYPDNPAYLSFAAGLYHKLPDYGKEAAVWELFLDAAPSPAAACPQIGRAYGKAGFPDKELDAYRRCLAFSPADKASIFNYALALEMRGRPDEAINLYRNLANLYDKSGNREGALDAYAAVRRLQRGTAAAARKPGAPRREAPQ